MKKLFFWVVPVLVAFFVSSGLVADDEKQPNPTIKDKTLQENVKLLQGVSARQVLEKPDKRGVISSYQTIYDKVYFRNGNMSIDTSSDRENESSERVFITGLNHDLITDDCIIYHFLIGKEHLLCVWQIGIQNFTNQSGDNVRLKKFTVDPKIALEYYKNKSKQ